MPAEFSSPPGPATELPGSDAAADADLPASDAAADVVVRPALATDIRALRELTAPYARQRRLVAKPPVAYYESVQEFEVAVADGGLPVEGEIENLELPGSPGRSASGAGEANQGIAGGSKASQVLIGCGALHVMWEDLAEIRTLAVRPDWHHRGVGHLILDALLARARQLGLSRVFCLTFEVEFFARHGFTEIQGIPISPEVYAELLRSHDDGVAEFLDLARVKPNTLGNTRMLLRL